MKYQIILVPFPFDDFSATKVRPAICLTNKIGIYDHVVIAFITSQASKANEDSDLMLNATDNDFSQTGLKTTSAIRLHKLVTVPGRIIQRTLGDLPDKFHFDLAQKLREMFAI